MQYLFIKKKRNSKYNTNKEEGFFSKKLEEEVKTEWPVVLVLMEVQNGTIPQRFVRLNIGLWRWCWQKNYPSGATEHTDTTLGARWNAFPFTTRSKEGRKAVDRRGRRQWRGKEWQLRRPLGRRPSTTAATAIDRYSTHYTAHTSTRTTSAITRLITQAFTVKLNLFYFVFKEAHEEKPRM